MPTVELRTQVALTGATGFIGRHITLALADAGLSVRALTRRPPPQDLRGTPVEWVRGHLADGAALRRLVQGADVVVHCAGAVRGATRASFHEINASGTRLLVAAASARERPPRFLLVSSLAAREPHLSWYAASKREAEDVLREHSGDMPGTVFRPTAVYGPGDREMRALFTAMRRGVLPVPGAQDARVTLLHVRDLAAAVVCWARRQDAVPGTFELHDGAPGGYDWPSIARIAEEAWGRRVRRLPVPVPFLTTVAWTNLGLARLLGYAPMLTPGKVNELTHRDWTCDNEPVTRALAWEPRLDLATGLRDLVEHGDL